MAIINLRDKWIRYYDSMGRPNNSVLEALKRYLQDESLDKKQKPFDTSSFQIENVRNCPQQQNGR
jgi:sentrin-specific protease 1